MKILNYKYCAPDPSTLKVLELDRAGYMTAQYIDIMSSFVDSIKLSGKVAFLYAGGVMLPASEVRMTTDNGKHRESTNASKVAIRELGAYGMHKWIGAFKDKDKIVYANINANTCASSMFSLYEASKLLDDGYDEVIIIAEEKTSYSTLRLFDEMGIDIPVSEGCVIVHLGKAANPADEDITDCKWSYTYNSNPFGTTGEGYKKVLSDCDVVKPHGTGTANNEAAEIAITEGKNQLRYKETYGHSQGVSGLLEVCMALDDKEALGDILCVSSGLGGFYGSCVLHKGK